MAVPATKTFTNGVLDSSDLNTYVRDPIQYLLSRTMAELRQTVAQSIPSGTFTGITFDVEDLDTDGGHSTSSNTSRFTAPNAGWYFCSGGVGFSASATGQRGAAWAVNGTTLNGTSVFVNASAAFTTIIAARSKLLYLNVSDYVELQALQNTGGALNTNVTTDGQSSMSVQWVRGG